MAMPSLGDDNFRFGKFAIQLQLKPLDGSAISCTRMIFLDAESDSFQQLSLLASN